MCNTDRKEINPRVNRNDNTSTLKPGTGKASEPQESGESEETVRSNSETGISTKAGAVFKLNLLSIKAGAVFNPSTFPRTDRKDINLPGQQGCSIAYGIH